MFKNQGETFKWKSGRYFRPREQTNEEKGIVSNAWTSLGHFSRTMMPKHKFQTGLTLINSFCCDMKRCLKIKLYQEIVVSNNTCFLFKFKRDFYTLVSVCIYFRMCVYFRWKLESFKKKLIEVVCFIIIPYWPQKTHEKHKIYMNIWENVMLLFCSRVKAKNQKH